MKSQFTMIIRNGSYVDDEVLNDMVGTVSPVAVNGRTYDLTITEVFVVHVNGIPRGIQVNSES